VLTGAACPFLVGPAGAMPANPRGIDVASRHEVAPTVITSPQEAPRKPGTAALVAREVAQAAREIKARLAGLAEDKRTVTVGFFTCPTNANATGGALLRHLLTQELKKAGVAVVATGGVGVSGKFRNATDPDSRAVAVKVTFELENEDGEKVGQPFSHVVLGEGVMAELFGTTASFSPESSPQERGVTLTGSIRRPTVAVEGSRVASREGNQFAIEVLAADRPEDDDDLSGLRYRPLRSRSRGGLAFVEVKPGQFYAVRLLNGSDADAAVTLSIDGLSAFTLSKDKNEDGLPSYSHLLVPARSNIVVKGWFLRGDETSLFTVTGFGDSVARGKGSSLADVGTITATFAACTRPKPRPVPPSAAADDAEGPRSSPPATGKGPVVRVAYGFAERKIGAILDIVSVRYVWAPATPPSERPRAGARPGD
jgi:hypothetical protein